MHLVFCLRPCGTCSFPASHVCGNCWKPDNQERKAALTENDLADAVAQRWVAEVLALVERGQSPEASGEIRRLQTLLDEWEILRVVAVRRAILARLQAAQIGRVLALINVQQLAPHDPERSN